MAPALVACIVWEEFFSIHTLCLFGVHKCSSRPLRVNPRLSKKYLKILIVRLNPLTVSFLHSETPSLHSDTWGCPQALQCHPGVMDRCFEFSEVTSDEFLLL